MSPTAVYSRSESSSEATALPVFHMKGPALVIGSLSTAQEGKYQSLITELELTRKVDRQLLDRLVDEGTLSFCFIRKF